MLNILLPFFIGLILWTCVLMVLEKEKIIHIMIYMELIVIFIACSFMTLSVIYTNTNYFEYYALFILTFGAIEMAIVLTLLISYYRIKGALSIRMMNLLHS